MNVREALIEIGKHAPCSHDCVDTDLGNGKVWARCDDCGQTISQESMVRLRDAHNKFMLALQVIQDAIEKPCVHDLANAWSQCTTADF